LAISVGGFLGALEAEFVQQVQQAEGEEEVFLLDIHQSCVAQRDEIIGDSQ